MNGIASRVFAPAVLLLAALLSLTPSAMSQANVTGQWQTLPYTMPINPIHVSLLYTGDVLITPGSGNDAQNPLFQAGLWDPKAGTITVQMVDYDTFCNGMVSLPDGRAIIAGGTSSYGPPFLGISRMIIYDPATGQFTDQQSMAHGRWYPTVTTLGDGREMVFSGLSDTGPMNSTIEFYTVGAGWSPEYPTPWTPPTYPRMHLLPNGNLFYSGPDPNSHFYNPSTNTWTLNVANTNYGGFRLYGSSVLLPLTPANGYKPRVIIFGGGTNTTPATATSEIIDLSAANPQWVYGPTMVQPRIEMDATILPDGRVLTLGGSVNDEDATTAGLNAEIYDPNTNLLSAAGTEAYARLYHTVSLLMPDGTVWVAGGNPLRGVYETHMEIYSPSYLFNPDGSPATRPSITSVSASKIGYGNAFQVQTPDAANISSVVLMRLGSSTHAFDMDQRYVGLSYTAGSGILNVVAPPTSNIAPPGYYMLFILNSAGIPSVASIVQMSANPNDQPPHSTITSPASDATVIAGQSISFAGTATDPDGTISGYYWTFFGGNPSFSNVANPGNVTYTVPGTYVATLTATDNAGVTEPHPATRIITVPDFSIAVSPTFQSVAPGGSATYTVTATGGPGFTGNVALSVSGLPAGASASFSPASITNSGSATMTISTSSSLAAQGYSITITAVSGIIGHSTIFSMLVSQSGGTPAINLAGFSTAGMQFNGNAKLNGTRLQVTDSATQNEAGSAYWTTPVNVQAFTSDFTFQLSNPNPDASLADGFTFVLQNAGLTALGSAGGGLGFSGLAPSVAVKFDLFDNQGEGDNSTGLFIDGAAPTIPATTIGGGVNLHSRDVLQAHIVYDGKTLTLTITDTTVGGSFTTSWPVNIPGTFGSNTAFAGFTGGTGGNTATQEILNWTYAVNTVTFPAPPPTFSPLAGTYSSAQGVTISDAAFGASIFYTLDGTTPATTAGGSTMQYTAPIVVGATTTITAIAAGTGLTPSPTASAAYTIQGGGTPAINFGPGFLAAGMQFNGHTKLNGTRLQLTDNSSSLEGASAYWTTPVNVQSFTNDFTFQLTNASADGFTFVLQNAGLTALGAVGGGLGYSGMTPAAAVKFDLYDNSGEGNNSTGLFLEGASPTVPATTLGGGVSLHSGDILQVHMVYDGTTLTMTITDTANPTQTFTTSWTVNLPTTLGSNTAWAGFTAGTGGNTATQEILTWTYGSAAGATQTATPAFNPVAGNYTGTQSVIVSDTTAGASIFYTVDGTTPATTAGGSTIQYSAPISVAASETVNAIATAAGASASAVASAGYTITPLAAATPVISPAAGTYTRVQTVTITDTTAGAAIHYTVDGTTPTASSPTYTAGFTVNATTTVMALATATGFTPSATASSAYTINLQPTATPVMNPAAGTYTTAQTVNITDATPGAIIHYTVDGTTPTASSPTYTAGFTVNATTTVMALATATGFTPSATASSAYTINLQPTATPVVNPAAGTYTTVQTVTITDTTAGAAIHYTVDGTTPTASSPTYTAGFTVNATTTVMAMATATGSAPSATASSAYTINLPKAATPAIRPGTGTYNSIQTITITDTTTGAVIYYTLDGTTPTIASTKYTAAFPLNASATVKAVAISPTTSLSAVATATYTINLPKAATPVIKPNAGTYTAAQTVTITDTTTGAAIHYTLDGTTPTITSPSYTAAFQVAATTTVKAIATAAANSPSAVATSTFTITQPAAATPVIKPNAGTYTTVQTVTITDTTAGAVIYYTLDGTAPTITSPTYAAALTVNATTTVKAMAAATGFANSAVSTATYTINLPLAATPVIKPNAGTYTAAQTVTITDTTTGAAIQYTLDGTTPTITSPTYTAAFQVAATTTVKAIATAAANSPSAVATSTFTITQPAAATPVINPAPGTYTTAQTVTITDTTAGAVIHYTLDGTAPAITSPIYTAALTVNATTTVKAMAAATGFANSAVATGAYIISSGGAPGPKLVQHGGIDCGTAATCNLKFGSNTTAGNMIILALRVGHALGTVTVTDTNKNTYTQAVTKSNPNDVHQLYLFYAQNTASAADTVTVTVSTSNPLVRMAILEYSGVLATGALDQVSSAVGSGTAVSSGSVTTTAAHELLIGVGANANGADWTAGAGWVMHDAPVNKLADEDQIVTAPTTSAATFNLAKSDIWTAIVATFKTQ